MGGVEMHTHTVITEKDQLNVLSGSQSRLVPLVTIITLVLALVWVASMTILSQILTLHLTASLILLTMPFTLYVHRVILLPTYVHMSLALIVQCGSNQR